MEDAVRGVYTLHFASCTPNIGLYQEYKGHRRLGPLFEPALSVRDGVVAIPQGPGLGMVHAGEFLRDAQSLLGASQR